MAKICPLRPPLRPVSLANRYFGYIVTVILTGYAKAEKDIMREIFKLKDELTLIIVAHRTNTLENCSRIIEVKNGTIS